MTTLLTALLVAALAALIASAATGVALMMLAAASRPAVVQGPNTGDRTPSPTGRLRLMPLAGLAVAAGALVLAVVVRAAAAGHAPWSNLHEFSVAFAAATAIAFLLLARTWPIAGLAPLAALLTGGMVVVALLLDADVRPLVPALQQPVLLTVHVGAAVAAYAMAGLAAIGAVTELAQRAAGDRIALLPSAAISRALGHRAVLIGFPILTAAIVLGAIWANLAWRAFWSNDPKELAAAATWVVFGAYLHVANRRDRWGAAAPWLILLGFAGVLFTYIGAGLFIVGEHSYGTG
jgi:ABC-type transport system involved in cytochrome c biogenesis permease subunit